MFFDNIYKGKKVFITGHTGFKGSWLLTWLHLSDATIKGYSLAPSPDHKLYDSIGGNNLCESHFGDILDNAVLEKSILDFAPDFIFHLAAQPIVSVSYEDPVNTFAINAIGTANVLNAVRKLSNPCVVIAITTDKVYHNYEWPYPYRENDRLGGYDPYSASKACAELIIDSYRNSFFNTHTYEQHQKLIAAARAGNVIGGGDWAKNRILPDIVRAFQKNEAVVIRNPASVRPWQHVLEPVAAYLLLGKKMAQEPLKYSNEYNFGPYISECWPVEKMVQCAIDEWGAGSYTKMGQQSGKIHEAGLLMLDVSKAQKELGWKPVYTAGEAIKKTIQWYKRYDGNNAYELVKSDIESFPVDFVK